uniref:Uncharacterized protein n=1 Tax=Kalanchoe fedtschenkoi TaxID=63787 RepID=A0A7N0ZS68_KALFE
MAPSEEHTQLQGSPTSTKNLNRNKKSASFITDVFLFIAGALAACLLVWTFWSFVNPYASPGSGFTQSVTERGGDLDSGVALESSERGGGGLELGSDAEERTFYDDPELSYMIGKPVKDWDEKRRFWLKSHPSFAGGALERVMVVTGSQPGPCKNPIGDHLLLRFFKNKVDYCRIHGYDLFYNNVLLHPEMSSFWAKLPVVRAAMLAHPETEWIWWVDSDALFTDMEFKPPFQKYEGFNFVVHGWDHLVYENRSWTSLNAGVFLIRNCQWSMDFMEVWARMGPQSPEYAKWGEIQRSIFKDKLFPASDDQAGLIYLILQEHEKWGKRIFLEHDFYLESYWVDMVSKLQNFTQAKQKAEQDDQRLRRRHAEKVTEAYGARRAEMVKDAGLGYDFGGMSGPVIIHFTGCEPCTGNHNELYNGASCWDGMNRALTFADNQVLRNYGFVHPDLSNSASVSPLPFDYPAPAKEAENETLAT